MRECTFLMILIGLLLLNPISTFSAVLFSKDFNSEPYGWAGERPGKCITYPDWNSCATDYWAYQHLASGGWNETGGVRLIYRQGYEQAAMGWYDSSSALRNWQQGDRFYVRFRIKFDTTLRWDGTGSQQNKMFIWGAGTHGGMNHRIMLHQEKDHGTSPCADMAEQYSNDNYGLFSLKRNIQEFCTPYVPITYDQWYHIQFYARSSTTADTNDAEFKIWVNNNNEAVPSSMFIGGFNLAVAGIWDQGFSFGGFWTDVNTNRDVSWIVDDFQIADMFDPAWAPSIPSPPSNLRVP